MKMNLVAYPQLQSVLKQNKNIVYLCGAGLSMALGEHKYSWYNWIDAGRKYLSTEESEGLHTLLNSKEENALIRAAGYVLSKTKVNGTYNDYMNATVGSLTVKDNSLADSFRSINRVGDFIATTNYDLLLERATGLGSFSYTQPGDILSSLQGDKEREIIHIHGLYDFSRGVDEIIADSDQYNSILVNEGAQFIQNLLSTTTVIIIGCGSTVDDPNLSRFLSFANSKLNINVPYFYLYKGDVSNATSEMPNNLIPISYGDDYSDLPVFLNEITLYRLNHLTSSKLMRVNPYLPPSVGASAYGRLHFSNEFIKFIGREEELHQLNYFAQCDCKQSWWAVTGDGGYGKSRLLLEWLKCLPNNWFGFFAETRAKLVDYEQFKPFNNTVIVLDYVLGNEHECAKIISMMMDVFSGSPYKLRIILVERFYEENKTGWCDTVINELKPQLKTNFLNSCFSGEKLVPLKIGRLSTTDELEYIKKYIESYVNILGGDLKGKYATNHHETSLCIHEEFCTSLNEEYRRPLFLNMFVEVWISKDGVVDIGGVRDLLGHFLDKEASRWLRRLGNDKSLLYAYQILLAFAAASQIYVLQDEVGIFQKYTDKLLAFIEAEMVAGRRKVSLDDLSMYQEYAHDYSSIEGSDWIERHEKIQAIVNNPDYLEKDENGAPILLTILKPEYPDIILEFIVDYYIDKEHWIVFAQKVRDYENVFFNTFLIRGMEDFPDSEAFIEMYFAPLKDPKDTFGFVIGSIIYAREFAELGKFPDIISTLQSAGMSDAFGLHELELWRRIVIVYGEREEHDQLYSTAFKFIDYIKEREKIPAVVDNNVSEVVEIICAELLRLKQPELCAELIGHFNSIAYNVSIATACCKAYYYLADYELYHGNLKDIRRYLKGILRYVRKYPKDDKIIQCFVDTTDAIREIINRDSVVGMLNDITPIVKQAYVINKNEKIAEVLAITETSRFFENIFVGNCRLAKKSQMSINKLFRYFKDNEDVILSYATVTAFEYLEQGKNVSSKKLNQFRKWKDTYPERKGLLEAYGKMLLARWFNLVHSEKEDKAKPVFQEVETIATTLESQHQMSELLVRTMQIRAIGCYLDFYYL